MNDPLGKCWSWTHDKGIPAEEGRFVCASCVSEEPKILKIVKELGKVKQAVELFFDDCRKQKPHPSQYKILQGIISDFFGAADSSLKLGSAFRIDIQSATQRELDIVVDWNSGEWIGGTRRDILNFPPLVHIEVGYRSRFDLKKFMEDFQDIHETVVAGAALQPSRKVWTAFVGLGPGWEGHLDSIAPSLHEYFHDRPPQKILIQGERLLWDFPDMLIFPGFMFKKHEFCSEPGLIDNWPVYVQHGAAENDPVRQFRPLAIARGFFEAFVRAAKQGRLETGPSWSDRDSSGIMGPNFRLERYPQQAISLKHAPPDLFARDPSFGLMRFPYFRALPLRCCMGKRFGYLRDMNSEFDGVGISVIRSN